MIKSKQLSKNTMAISMIIGTILMLAITVSLSATTYVFVTNSFEDSNMQSNARLMSMIDMEFSENTKELEVRHITGDTFDDAIKFQSSGSSTPTDWWNGNWHKRVEFSVSSTESISNYQLKIDINYDSDMQQDFNDVRFIDGDDSTVLSYWIETISTGNQATFWVKIPSLSIGENNFYLYYGNSVASSSSNPTTTFDSFVNFNHDSLVSHHGSAHDSSDPQDVEPNSYSILDDYTIKFDGNTWKGILKNLEIYGDGSQILSFDYKSTDVNDPEISGVGFDINEDLDSNHDDDHFYEVHGSQNWGIQKAHDYAGTGDWKSYMISLDDFSGTFDRFIINNDEDDLDNTNSFYRNIRIQKSISTTPTVSLSFSNEETSTVPEPSYQLNNLQIAINDEPVQYESIKISSGGTSLRGGDILTVTFSDVNLPTHGDTVSIRYTPTNQLIKVQMI